MIRILLVDDNLDDLQRTRDTLLAAGLGESLRVARGGQEALDYLFGRGQFQARRRFPLPDLVLLDLNMPAIDGYAVLKQVRRASALRRIPVVVLCMSQQEGERVMRYEVRANGYLVKPVNGESLAGFDQQVRNWTLRLDLPEAATVASRPFVRSARDEPPPCRSQASTLSARPPVPSR